MKSAFAVHNFSQHWILDHEWSMCNHNRPFNSELGLIRFLSTVSGDQEKAEATRQHFQTHYGTYLWSITFYIINADADIIPLSCSK